MTEKDWKLLATHYELLLEQPELRKLEGHSWIIYRVGTTIRIDITK